MHFLSMHLRSGSYDLLLLSCAAWQSHIEAKAVSEVNYTSVINMWTVGLEES